MIDSNRDPLMSSELAVVEAGLQRRGYAVLTGAGFVRRGVIDTSAASELAAWFGRPSTRDGGSEIWDVRPRSTNPADTFSQRAGDAGLHTDAAYHERQEDRFALFCVNPARDGGLTRLLRRSDLIRGLGADLERRLQVPQWRWRVPEVFGGGVSGRLPVLDGETVRWRLDNLVIPGDLHRSAEAFAGHVESHPMLIQFLLPPDSMLICDNLRVLHGRTTFADPSRWLVRIRLVTP